MSERLPITKRVLEIIKKNGLTLSSNPVIAEIELTSYTIIYIEAQKDELLDQQRKRNEKK